ncbi:MAG: hypothetical protein ACKERG_03925 [Candidatus Hodgkinia cicadicola]
MSRARWAALGWAGKGVVDVAEAVENGIHRGRRSRRSRRAAAGGCGGVEGWKWGCVDGAPEE